MTLQRLPLAVFLILFACSSPKVVAPASVSSPPTSPIPSSTPSPSPSPSPLPPSSPSPKASPKPPQGSAFQGQISTIDRSRLTHSWRDGCPVGVENLRLLTLSYWGFDSQVRNGELVVHRDQAQKVVAAMKRVFEARFPIDKMEIVDVYEGSDDRSMEANNSSAFNCRQVESRPGVWSQHAYGRAIDINPIQNPWVSAAGEVDPPNGAPYADRSKDATGMIHSKGPVVRAFSAVGWSWGGYWSSSKDYQHFSSNGR